MWHVGRLGLISLFLLSPAAHVQAQDDAPALGADVPSVVVVPEKSPVTAGVLEWFLPTLGYGYAGDWARGIPSGLVRITGLGLVFSQQFVLFGSPPPCRGRCVVGAVMAGVGTIWAIIDAGRTASRENARRRDTILGTTVMPTLGPTGTGLGLYFSVGL